MFITGYVVLGLLIAAYLYLVWKARQDAQLAREERQQADELLKAVEKEIEPTKKLFKEGQEYYRCAKEISRLHAEFEERSSQYWVGLLCHGEGFRGSEEAHDIIRRMIQVLEEIRQRDTTTDWESLIIQLNQLIS